MMQSEIRQAIVAEAKTWLLTPWHHRQCCKGAGVDCVFFLVGVYNAVGLTNINNADVPYYPIDIMMHRSEETVLDCVMQYAHEVDFPQPGDIAVWKYGRIYSHAAIVLDYPNIIHAHRGLKMVALDDAEKGELSGREVRFYSLSGIKA